MRNIDSLAQLKIMQNWVDEHRLEESNPAENI